MDVEYESYRVLIFARNSNRPITFVFKLRSFGLILGCILPHLQKLMVLRDFRLFKNNSERLKNAREKTPKKKTRSVTSEKNENSNLHAYLPIILGLSTTIFGFSLFGSSLAGFSIFGSAFWGGGTVFGTAYFADSVFGNAYFGRSLFGSRKGIFWETVYFSYSKMIVGVAIKHLSVLNSSKSILSGLNPFQNYQLYILIFVLFLFLIRHVTHI